MSRSLHPALHRTWVLLDSLPKGATVIDRYGDKWTFMGLYWYSALRGEDMPFSAFEVAQFGPVKAVTEGLTA